MPTLALKNPLRSSRFWRRVMLYPLLGYIGWCATLYFYQDQLLFPIDAAGVPLNRPGPRVEVRRLDIGGNRQVESWFLPAASNNDNRPRPAVMYFHGNAELIDYQDSAPAGYHQVGCSVLLPEYRGYGRSGGEPSEEAILEDAIKFYDQLCARPDVDSSRIVFHGRSLGGGFATQLAMKRPPAALILESTFTSVAEMAYSYGVPAFLAKNPLRTNRVLSYVRCPLLIFHGTQDTIIPIEHGRALHQLVPAATYIEYDCGHNDFPGPRNEADYWKRIYRFLADAKLIE